MTKQIPNKVRRRIQRLRAMAEDTSSENEAMIAARRLHALLAEYGIHEFEIEEDGGAIETEAVEYDAAVAAQWSGIIADKVASLYFCHCYQTSNGLRGKAWRRTYHITGSRNFRSTATIMIKAIIQAVDREARAQSAAMKKQDPDHHGWSFICSFRIAAARRIANRCRELIVQAHQGELQDEEGNTLPVMASMYDREIRAAEDYLQAQGMQFRRSSARSQASSAAGSLAGKNYGDKVSLTQNLGKSVRSHQLPSK